MADMLAAGAAWLTERLRSSAASTVAYVRSGNTATVPATIGQSRFESQDGNGVIEQWESRDFIIKTDELPYGEPQRGDRIYEQLGGVAQIYAPVSRTRPAGPRATLARSHWSRAQRTLQSPPAGQRHSPGRRTARTPQHRS